MGIIFTNLILTIYCLLTTQTQHISYFYDGIWNMCFPSLLIESYSCVCLLASKHEPDGRVILAEFETLRILNTYVPNNGWKEEEVVVVAVAVPEAPRRLSV